MKRLLPPLPGRLLLAGLLLLLACARQEATPTDYYLVYPEYRPLLMARATLESAVAATAPQAMRHTGKIVLSGDYLFVGEQYEGVHIIDNHDPSRPRPVAFLRIPGNVDVALQGSILYADSGPDLLAFDLSDPSHAQLLSRTRSAFRELPMPVAGVLEEACQPANRPAGAVVVGWRKLAAGEALPVKVPNPRSGPFFSVNTATLTTPAPAALGENGKAGSLARFAILNRVLYTVDDQSMHLFGLQDPTTPVAGPVVQLGLGIETIFPYDHYLFIGSQTGMAFYDMAVPATPKWVGGISHVKSCDPVVVDGRFAYVTLRSTPAGSNSQGLMMGRCGTTQTDELDVVDLTTLSQARLARTYPMVGPLGLGVENNRLYVCDDGLKVFDTSQAPALTQVQQFASVLTDVIPNGDYLLGVGPGGLYQYRVGSAGLQQVSVLAIAAD